MDNAAASTFRGIRVGVRAAIIQNDEILLVECRDDFGPYRFAAELGLDEGTHFNLPGGGVESGESLLQALHRETLEETGKIIEAGRLLMVYEYVPSSYSNAERMRYGHIQKVDFVFECRPKSDSGISLLPDPPQIGLRWFPLNNLVRAPLLPSLGREIIAALQSSESRDPFCRDYHESIYAAAPSGNQPA